jgi:flagellar protein FlaG
MSVSFPKVGAGESVRKPPESKPRGAAAGGFARDLAVTGAGDAPPPAVAAEVRAAATAASRLHELGRELRFDHDEASGRVRIELRDREGNLLRRVPAAEAFEFSQGRVSD